MAINEQKGVSLIITLFVMIIILVVVSSISVLLYSEVKVVRNMSDSMVSIFAADSGIEKVLYYDRQVLPTVNSGDSCILNSNCKSGQTCSDNGYCVRGLCSMLSSCVKDDNPNPNDSYDHSIYCNNTSTTPIFNGCDENKCDNCEIYFETTFNGKTYYTTAKVYPDQQDSDFEIDSRGTFGGAQRQIQILITPPE